MRPNFNSRGIKLIIGLGNPGQQYQTTYHNVGVLFLNYLKKKNVLPITHHKLLISESYMNQSGGFVKMAMKKNGVKPEELLIVHDDSDIALGQFKISFGRGAAGHKGVESVIGALKTKNFWRLRIGIRPVGPTNFIRKIKASSLVLKKISPANKKILQKVFRQIYNLLINTSK